MSALLDSIVMGGEYRDLLTGFTGIVTAKSEYLTGCDRVLLEPSKLTADGNVVDGRWFDVHCIERCGDTVFSLPTPVPEKAEPKARQSRPRGGPQQYTPPGR